MIHKRSIIIPVLTFAAILIVLLLTAVFYRDQPDVVFYLAGGAVLFVVAGVLFFIFGLFFPLNSLNHILKSLARNEPAAPEKLPGLHEFMEMEQSLRQQIERLSEVSAMAEQLARGEIDEDFYVQGEGDRLGMSVLKLKEGIIRSNEEVLQRRKLDEQQTWASHGYAHFGNLLRDLDQEREEVSAGFISQLARYVDMEAGGFFLLRHDEEAGPVYELTGAYAFDRQKKISSVYRVGEGLVGRCAIEKQPIVITDVPPGYIRIRSGMGEDDPSTLILIPVIFDELVPGVIELASFSKVEQYKIDFLTELGKSIASTISRTTQPD